MTELFFAPATKTERPGGWTPYDNLQKTVLSPVTNPAKFGLPLKYSIVPVWGITDGSANYYADKIHSGSYMVFYTGNRKYPYVAQIREFLPNKTKIAKDIFPSFRQANTGNTPGEPWSNIIILEAVWTANIPLREIQHWRNVPEDNVIRNFCRVPTNRRRRIERNQIRVKEWICDKKRRLVSLSVETKLLTDIDRPLYQLQSDSQILDTLVGALAYSKDDLSDSLQKDIVKKFKSFHGI